jgi:imidazolonepropionase-like amidohydrolase
MKDFFYSFLFIFAACTASKNQEAEESGSANILFKNANIIGDSSGAAIATDILVENGKITDIGKGLSGADATTVDLSGKTVMPAIISSHVHIGTLKGTTSSAENYTRENILNQLNKYASYGVTNIQVLGTDRPLLFANGFYDSIRNGLMHGARMLSAGYGFNVPQANVDPNSAQSLVYRPASASQVPAEMDSLAALKIAIVKMWVDDFNKTLPKMDPAVYKAIIDEAHKRNMKVAAHVYYLADARKLVEDGVDILAHSIRDSVVDGAFLALMKGKNTTYIPTLALEKFAYTYGGETEWINDPFFKASLEPGVYEMITSEKYKTDTKNSPAYARSENAFRISLINVKKIFDAGILVALGTDSGAFPIRTQGFAEHLEMQLLVEAGLTPSQALGVATKNSAKTLSLDEFGTIAKGKIADLLILNSDPSSNIKNTRDIFAVYKEGVKVK